MARFEEWGSGGGGVMAEGVFPRLTRMALGSDVPLLFHARSRMVPFLIFFLFSSSALFWLFPRVFSPPSRLPFSNLLPRRRKLRFILPHFLAATSLLASRASDSVVALFAFYGYRKWSYEGPSGPQVLDPQVASALCWRI